MCTSSRGGAVGARDGNGREGGGGRSCTDTRIHDLVLATITVLRPKIRADL